jgi:hypothetical protein
MLGMDRRRGRRSKNGLVEKSRHIAVSDLRHALKHEEGRDRQRVRIRSGAAAGLTISIQWSQLRYGWRPWFLCPACAKPSGRLYTEPAQGWKCRSCLGLHYRSQRGPEAGPRRDHHRHLARSRAIRRRLGQPGGWLGSELPDKPRHMRMRTYLLLIEELVEHQQHALRFLQSRFRPTLPDWARSLILARARS